jgi:enhancing lycopene biosynthesis protein 2
MENVKKFAVILSGCGVFDGSEIHEAVLTLLAISRQGCQYEVFAPDVMQHHVINHYSRQETGEKRNVLVESARIARGKIKPLSLFRAEAFDGLIFPGGYGAAKNLSDYAFKGHGMTVLKETEEAVLQMVALKKPVGALCIAPVILAKILGDVEVTIGSDPGTARDIEKMGAMHLQTTHSQIITDKKYKVVTTPCYMLDASVVQIAEGAENVVKEMLRLMQ